MMTQATAASAQPERVARVSLPTVSTTKLLWALAFSVIGAGYLGARIVSWQLNTQFEDHDSLGYLEQIAVFLTFEWKRIAALGPDATPFYPFVAALFALPGWSVETAARLCSLAFSCLLFVSLIGIARHIGGLAAGALGLLLVAFNAELIRLSHSVLTEPSFIATIYLALWLFLEQRDRLSLVYAAVLGLILGLAFLNRVEGLIFALAFPLLQWGYTFVAGRGRDRVKRLLLWSSICYLIFLACAAPQVWHVSNKLGQFAINGRQVWTLLLNRPGAGDYEQEVYGLDYSPSQINISYFFDHPDQVAEVSASFDPIEYLRRVLANLGTLNHEALGTLIGVFASVFFALAVAWQLQERRYPSLLVICGFLLVGLAGPLLHNVVIRHIAVIAPLVLLVAGDGILRTAQGAIQSLRAPRRLVLPVALALTGALIASSAVPLYQLFVLEDAVNSEYRAEDLRPIVAEINKATEHELDHPPRMVDRKNYVAREVQDAVSIPLPYTDVAGLQAYMRLNAADFLVLRYDYRVQRRPFHAEFADGDPPSNFELLYRGRDSFAILNELYRYRLPGGQNAGQS